MSNTSRAFPRRRAVALGAAVSALAVTGAALASAGPAGAAAPSQAVRGTCTGNAIVTMRVTHSDPRHLEASFEVDHAKVGSVWKVTLRHNGSTYFTGKRTAGADHSFSVDRVVRNLAGADRFHGRAVSMTSGQVCTVRAIG